MLRKKVHAEFADGEESPDAQEVILLQEDDLAAILVAIRELAYNKGTDIFEIPQSIQPLMDEMDVN